MTIGSCLQKVLGVSVCLLMLPSLAAGSTIIGQVSGTINLQLYPFHDTRPENTADGWVEVPNPGQYHTGNVALLDVSESIDGSGYYSTGGLSRIDYTPVQNTAGAAVLDIHTVADTLGRGDGGGGDASLNIQITFSQPVFYRFEAQAIGAPYQYEVSFNGRYADAWYDAFGTYGGSFPLIYHPESCSAVGWDTYVDQGTLPAGTYNLSVAAFSALNRYGDGSSSEGTARLRVYMLGDVDFDGFIGIADLNGVLSHWGQTVVSDVWSAGDLDADGVVGINDLNIVLTNWGAGTNQGLPEPAAVTVGLCALLLVSNRRPGRSARDTS